MAWHDDLTAVATERGAALVGYAYLLTGNQARAQDLVQEALARTWARPRRLADAAATEAYVRRAVLNAYLDEHRRESVWRRRRHLAALPEATAPGAGAAIDEAARRAGRPERGSAPASAPASCCASTTT